MLIAGIIVVVIVVVTIGFFAIRGFLRALGGWNRGND